MKRLLSQFALVLLLPGCRQMGTTLEESSMMFSAGICLPASTTKVCPDMNSAGDIPVYWETGDRIRIMDDRGESIYITEDSGTASARFAFDKTLEGNRRLNASDSYLGFYPDRNWLKVYSPCRKSSATTGCCIRWPHILQATHWSFPVSAAS